jgi:hypothetical protein
MGFSLDVKEAVLLLWGGTNRDSKQNTVEEAGVGGGEERRWEGRYEGREGEGNAGRQEEEQ